MRVEISIVTCWLLLAVYLAKEPVQAQGSLFPENFFNSGTKNTFKEASTVQIPETTTKDFLNSSLHSFSSLFDRVNNGADRQSPRHPSQITNLLSSTKSQESTEAPSPSLKTKLRGRKRNGRRGKVRPALTPENIAELRKTANEFISKDDEWLPNLLQLVFHTCVGGCDGCLNFAEKDNQGLEKTYASIKSLWAGTDARKWLSLADFIVLMGTEAAQIAINKSEDLNSLVSIEFHPGRKTCRDPDNYHLEHEFPKGDAKDGVDFLMREFGYEDRRMAIALLGAHSLGACRSENSGFRGRWDNTPLTLDNHYYKSLTEAPLWTAVPVNGTTQWNSSEPDGPMMLHSDMALLHTFDIVDSHNRPSCIESRDCGNSKDTGRISLYAASMHVWVHDFITAFLKMVDKKPAPKARKRRRKSKIGA